MTALPWVLVAVAVLSCSARTAEPARFASRAACEAAIIAMEPQRTARTQRGEYSVSSVSSVVHLSCRKVTE